MGQVPSSIFATCGMATGRSNAQVITTYSESELLSSLSLSARERILLGHTFAYLCMGTCFFKFFQFCNLRSLTSTYPVSRGIS